MKGVLVMGCPRSGTSYMTRLLGLHGVDFGSKSLTEGQAAQRGILGYGENDMFEGALMAQHNLSGGGCGHSPSELITELDVDTDELRVGLLDDKLEREVVGLKSANIVYAFPWWYENIFRDWPECDWTYVVMVRDPLEVIPSYYRMRCVPPAQTLALYKRTYQALMLWEEIYGLNFHWIDYPDGTGIKKLLTYLSIPYDKELMERAWTEPQSDKSQMHETYAWFDLFYESLKKKTL